MRDTTNSQVFGQTKLPERVEKEMEGPTKCAGKTVKRMEGRKSGDWMTFYGFLARSAVGGARGALR